MDESILKKYSQFQKQTETKNFDLKYMSIGLAGEVGELLNEIKKLERDDNFNLTLVRKDKIKLELGDILWYYQGICNRLDFNITQILESNIDKLNLKKNN